MRFVTLFVSVLFGIIPLAGIVWILLAGMITTVDGLFMVAILLSLAGAFFLNSFWELRDRGILTYLKRNRSDSPQSPPSSEAS